MKKNQRQVTKNKLTGQLEEFTKEVKSGIEQITDECKVKEERINKLEMEYLLLKCSLEEHADHITILYSKIEELSLTQNKVLF